MSKVEVTQLDGTGTEVERREHAKFEKAIVDLSGGPSLETPPPGEMPPPPR